MSLRSFIEQVLTSGLLKPRLVSNPARGASEAELAAVATLPIELREVLRWRNGLDLEVIRLHGAGNAYFRIHDLATGDGSVVVFASDPAGFQYFLAEGGAIMCYDHDGGEVTKVAESVEDFLCNYIFGKRAAEFGGKEWASDVAAALGN